MSAACPLLGFVVSVRRADGAALESTHVAGSLLALLEVNDLIAVERGRTYVIHREGSQTTEQDRELVVAWTRRWSAEASIAVGPLTDLSEPE